MSRRALQTLLIFSIGLFLSVLGVVKVHAASAAPSAKPVSLIADSTPTDTAVMPILSGQPAPNFRLLNQEGHAVALSDFNGKWVVLYFYPKDFSEGCTLEAHNFQRDIQLYAAANAVILGVSVDSVGAHKDFCSKEGLNFKLLADTAGTVSALYGSLHHWFGRKISARNTFIIGPDGTVDRIFKEVQPGTHSAQVLAALSELGTPLK